MHNKSSYKLSNNNKSTVISIYGYKLLVILNTFSLLAIVLLFIVTYVYTTKQKMYKLYSDMHHN